MKKKMILKIPTLRLSVVLIIIRYLIIVKSKQMRNNNKNNNNTLTRNLSAKFPAANTIRIFQ